MIIFMLFESEARDPAKAHEKPLPALRAQAQGGREEPTEGAERANGGVVVRLVILSK